MGWNHRYVGDHALSVARPVGCARSSEEELLVWGWSVVARRNFVHPLVRATPFLGRQWGTDFQDGAQGHCGFHNWPLAKDFTSSKGPCEESTHHGCFKAVCVSVFWSHLLRKCYVCSGIPYCNAKLQVGRYLYWVKILSTGIRHKKQEYNPGMAVLRACKTASHSNKDACSHCVQARW